MSNIRRVYKSRKTAVGNDVPTRKPVDLSISKEMERTLVLRMLSKHKHVGAHFVSEELNNLFGIIVRPSTVAAYMANLTRGTYGNKKITKKLL